MNKNIRWKVSTILAVLVIFAGVGVYPIVASNFGINSPSWLMQKQLKLGLDLKGGVHLVLRVQTDDAIRLETDQAAERLREALRMRNIMVMSIATPSISQIRVEGVQPTQDAAFRDAAADLATNFDRSPGTNGSYTFTMKPNIQNQLRLDSVVQARQTIERRVNELGVAEPQIAEQG
jgi:preprotein translocase subunit SecD